MFKTFIFDLDGTLINSMPDIAAGMNHVRNAFGLESWPEKSYFSRVGWGLAELVRRSLPDEYVEKGITLIKEYYLAHPFRYSKPFEGIPDFLQSLYKEGYGVGILTNKDHEVTQKITEHFFPFLDAKYILGANKGFNTKPDPEGLLHLLSLLKASPDSSVMVGDSEHDLETARAAGTSEISVTYGYREKKLLASYNPVAILDTVPELKTYISSHKAALQLV